MSFLFCFSSPCRYTAGWRTEKVKAEDCAMTTSAHYGNWMELLSFQRPADRHACAEALLQQSCFARRLPRAGFLTASGGACTAPHDAAAGPFGSPTLAAAPLHGPLGDRALTGRGGEPRQQPRLSPSCFPSWRGAGKAGRREYFSAPCSDGSLDWLLQSASRQEEARELRRLRRQLEQERL
ncbi:uncharacterized protein Tco025E_04642 [Trypanosoma conorhini]|uniref:Uncharacterized protein n=1 Tax=Trypanosoma conorhini TaxID=83891 RepID=A0A422PKA0_9TRYP|nr:uncharacterized protein Tco025E_04642 [Trypanosoma conorhini]RNF18139.1 hypothetical protein Tco025E_04642 [Trypanosoma conorhini]